MVFPDVQPVLGFYTFISHAGAHDLGQAINIHRMHVESVFDFLAHGIGPGLGPENTDLQWGISRVQALCGVFIQDGQSVRRGHRDALGPKIFDQAHLSLGHAARYRNGGQSKRVCA